MNENEQKQQLSLAYVHAVASRAGFACQQTLVDDDSVDVTLAARGWVHEKAVLRSPRLELQLKSTSQDVRREDHVAFTLPRKNYEELRLPTLIPRLLVVFLLPGNLEHWIEQTEEQMISRHCAYWTSVLQLPERTTQTISIKLPRTNLFSVDNLVKLMERASQKERL